MKPIKGQHGGLHGGHGHDPGHEKHSANNMPGAEPTVGRAPGTGPKFQHEEAGAVHKNAHDGAHQFGEQAPNPGPASKSAGTGGGTY